MARIFDKQSAALYEDWYQSSPGRAVESALERLIRDLTHPVPGEHALDIGCGTGNHILLLGKIGLQPTGVDASPYMIEEARKRLGHRCELKIGHAEDLPFDDNEFHTAFLINTLEFVDDPLEVLREAGRVAKNRVFVAVFNGLSWDGLIRKWQGYFGNSLFGSARLYNLWQLRSLLTRAFGNAPMVWGSTGTPQGLPTERWPFSKAAGPPKRSPFAPVLAMGVTLRYRFMTRVLPLRVGLKKVAGRSLVRPAGMEDARHRVGR